MRNSAHNHTAYNRRTIAGLFGIVCLGWIAAFGIAAAPAGAESLWAGGPDSTPVVVHPDGNTWGS
ncbi:hypothetical protein ACWGE1_10510 [Streptomyces sp. NPDC054932]